MTINASQKQNLSLKLTVVQNEFSTMIRGIAAVEVKRSAFEKTLEISARHEYL